MTNKSDATAAQRERRRLLRDAGARARGRRKRKSQRRIQIIRLRATDGGNGQAWSAEFAVDVPKFRYVGKEEFDDTGTLPHGCRLIRMGRPYL